MGNPGKILGASALGVTLCVAGLLSGCADKSGEEVAPAAAAGTSAKPRKADPELVSAVSEANSQVPVRVAFALQGKPVVGKPLDVRFSLTPLQPFDSVQANYDVSEGLQFTGNWVPLQLSMPAANTAVEHTISVIPDRDGIFSVTVTVIVDQNNSSATRTFSVPIIAGAGMVTRS